MITLSLYPQDIQTILKALGQMPLNDSIQTYMRVQQQLAEAQAAAVKIPGSTPPDPPAPPPAPNGTSKPLKN